MRRAAVTVIVVLLAVGAGLVAVFATNTTPQLGLDLQGGLSVVLAPKQQVPTDRLEKATDIVRERVDALGVAEPEIARQGDTIVVDLPGVKEVSRARQLIGTTAKLQFRPVLQAVPLGGPTGKTPVTEPSSPPTSTPDSTVSSTVSSVSSTPTTKANQQGLGGPATVLARAAAESTTTSTAKTTTTTGLGGEQVGAGQTAPDTQPIVAKDRDGQTLYQLGPTEVSGDAVKSARASFNSESGGWVVNVEFNSKGSKAWDDMAARYVNKQVAIVLDGVVQSAPVIRTTKFGGRAEISGNFTSGEAKDLALVLRFGSLPVELKEISVDAVSPTLGKDQLHAGLVAGLVGLAIVSLYVLIYYRLLGVVVWLSLGVTAGAIYAIVCWLGNAISLTLTLAGVVGLIVSIGIAADSNIVYFERVKEEMRAGRSVRSSADRAFKAAWRTIVAADFVTLLAAGLLWVLAIGSVKGFAFYLGLATLLDLAVSRWFMHPLVVMLGRNKRLSRSTWLGFGSLHGATEAAN